MLNFIAGASCNNLALNVHYTHEQTLDQFRSTLGIILWPGHQGAVTWRKEQNSLSQKVGENLRCGHALESIPGVFAC